MKKQIPYAIADYEQIVGEDYYFVDKTRFIRELEQYKVPVFLRPRRCVGTRFANQAVVIEFKHFPRTQGEKLGVLDWREPHQEEIDQVGRYAADLAHDYPELTVQRHVAYIVGATGFRFFSL